MSASAVQQQKSVADPAGVYDSLKPLWKRVRAVVSGERFVKDYDSYLDVVQFSNLLMPFSPSMTAQQFGFYKAEAEFPGIVSQYARIVIGGLLRKKPQLQLPDGVPEEATDWILNSFCQSQASLTAFLDDALWEELQTSRAWVYVDYPAVNTDEVLTKEEQLLLRPYPILWSAESIINWKKSTDPRTGAQILERIIIRDYEESFEKNEFHPELIDTVYVHELVDGFYQIRKYQKREAEAAVVAISGNIQKDFGQNSIGAVTSHYELIETNTNILMHGERLTFIPAWPLNGSILPQEPMLMPLVDKEIALYNKVSRRNHLLYGAATYTPVIASDMTEEEFDAIVGAGLGSWIKIHKEDTATILETPTAALIDMDRAIAANIEEMAKLGVRMLTPESMQSGVALEIRNSAQTAQLGTLNAKVSNQMAAVIAFMLNWRYELELRPVDVKFEMSADFNPVPIGADWMRLATEWYEKGLIPRTVWLQILKQNDMVPPEYNDEEGKVEMTQDEVVYTPVERERDYLAQQRAAIQLQQQLKDEENGDRT